MTDPKLRCVTSTGMFSDKKLKDIAYPFLLSIVLIGCSNTSDNNASLPKDAAGEEENVSSADDEESKSTQSSDNEDGIASSKKPDESDDNANEVQLDSSAVPSEEPQEDAIENEVDMNSDSDSVTQSDDENTSPDSSTTTDAVSEETALATDTASTTEPETESVLDRICSEQSLAVDYLPVRLMIALDMSGSMIKDNDNYAIAVEAISDTLSGFRGRFYFGFDTYPDVFRPASCDVDQPVWFDCGPDNEDAIIEWLNTNYPSRGSGDPLLLELEMFLLNADYAPLFRGNGQGDDSYLLIVADGGDCCGPSGSYDCDESWITEIGELTTQLLDAGTKTIVVGYTESANADILDAVAERGGTAFNTHIPAVDHAALSEALDTIAGTIFSCDFKINDPGPSSDPRKVNFYIGDEILGFDEDCVSNEGWTWVDENHTTVRFCEQACEQLKNTEVSQITAKFGCPTVIVV